MNLSTSATACFWAGSTSEGPVLAVQNARPPASSWRVKSTRSPCDDQRGLEYSCGEAKSLSPLPPALISISREAELLAPAGLLSRISEASSGAQLKSAHVCPLGLLASRCGSLPPAAVYRKLPDGCGTTKARTLLADQAKLVA